MSDMQVIEARNLSKHIGSQTILSDINLSLPAGRIVGLIGANGAGKTTLLKGILGLTSVSGDLFVLGRKPHANRAGLMEKVSYIADTAILPKWITVQQLIRYMQGVHSYFDVEKAHRLLAQTKIRFNAKVGTLSKGMITQLHLALVMAIDSQLLVLDEPTLGLDLLFRKQFYSNLLNEFYDGDKTILITTHQVEEVEHILTDVVFLHEGKVLLSDNVENLTCQYQKVFVSNVQKAEFQELNLDVVDEQPRLGGSNYLIDVGHVDQVLDSFEVSTPSIAEIFVGVIKLNSKGEL